MFATDLIKNRFFQIASIFTAIALIFFGFNYNTSESVETDEVANIISTEVSIEQVSNNKNTTAEENIDANNTTEVQTDNTESNTKEESTENSLKSNKE